MIQVYADSPALRSLERARQGYIEALQDIENHVIGADESRVHEEENGRALCQADTQEQSWHCADRFVYGMDHEKERALCVGHVTDHQGKGYNDYKEKKKIAKKTKNSDFKNKIFISSEQIIQQTQIIADEMIHSPKLSRLELLKEMYFDLKSEEEMKSFQEILVASLRENGPITNSEQKIICRLPHSNPFRIEMEKVMPIKKKNLALEKTISAEKIDHLHQ